MKKSGLVAGLLIGAGAVLIMAGALSAYPYIDSRLFRPGHTPVPTAVTDQPPIPSPSDERNEPGPTRRPTRVNLPTATASPVASTPIIVGVAPTATPGAVAPTTKKPKTAPPSRVVIPALSVDAAVVPVSLGKQEVEGQMYPVWDVPNDYTAGWHRTSVMLGEHGNIVLNGHNTSHGEVFRDLYTLGVGDEIILYSEHISRTYAVSEVLILPEGGQPLEVRLANGRYAMPTDDERLTLVTCHPYGSLRNRLIVVARPSRPVAPSEPPED